MKITTRLQLSTMMFLEFFVWGAWFVTLGTFLINNLHANGAQTGAVFSTQSWGAIIAPFIIGLIADRYFNAEKILGVLHIIGAVFLYQVYSIGAVTNVYPPVVFYYLLIYMILFMPTLALVNSVSFNQMSNTEKQFPPIRVWGTIGWIVAGLAISFFVWDSEANIKAGLIKNTFLMASIASLALGIFSFTLPKTPPKIAKGTKVKVSEIIGLDALKLLKDKN
ncbi:MAG TPA: MFS transporter, partial [Hanamia sp.]|nr:MFS transporter [Hanamia sp.]